VNEESWGEHNPVQASSEEALEKADRLAPLEEQEEKSANQKSDDEGLIRVDTSDLKLPSEFTGKNDEESHVLGLEPLTLIIIVFALAFIAFITYLISTEPSNVKAEPAPTVEQQP
jgi:hypothetical protein